MNVLSIDVEEWFTSYHSSQIDLTLWNDMPSRIAEGTDVFLSFLVKNKLQATFFILGWVAEQHKELVIRIKEAGYDVGFHSMYHELPAKQGKLKFEKDLVAGLDALESITGVRPVSYRAPGFSLNQIGRASCRERV